jgi:anti-sigma28 factor (negative regulator of flagellin synthesis)
MISTIQTSNMAYIQPNVAKDDSSKGVIKTEQSEGVDKVSAIKEQIANGTYKVDLTKTAQAAAEELI